ncbi:MAG: GntR family transcriptional regulator, partial [Candidatus Marsarchaeota archaeon]|nr:GntR family transcriptional regulator [Candidatus Marsarchaeota archaeon]
MNQVSGNQIDKSSPTALYHQLKEAIKREIWSSKLKIGSRIIPERELCKVYGVSRPTAARALTELVEEGILVREQGRGTFVADPGKRVDETFTLGIALYDSQYIMLPFFSCIIAGVSEVARESGYQVQLIITNAGAETDESSLYSRMLSQKKIDGLAVIDLYVKDRDLVDLHGHSVPIVLFDRMVPGHDFCSVLVDNRGGVFQLVEHLYELGHRNIGFVTVSLSHPPARERYEGYQSALQVKALECHPEWII